MTTSLIRALLSLLIALCSTVAYSLSAQNQPNIILINIDDLGWRDVGFMGSEYYETPHLDALAGQGMIFTNAYAAASNCAPSRACMLTGQWTPRHGVYTVNNSDRGKSATRKLVPEKNTLFLDEKHYLLSEALHDAGYQTCHAGKWHVSKDPLLRGFDVNIGGCEAGHPGSYYPPYKTVPLIAPSADYYLTNLIMDKTLDFVRSTGDKPFFLYYAPYAVHTPLHPYKALLDKYENKNPWNGQNNPKYATMVENMDAQVGRLINLLEASGKIDNTFILFISDNGGVYKITRQWPLRAGKGSYYEGGIREPMFAFWPGKIKAGTKNDEPVTNIDFFPTLLEIAGIKKPENKVLDGISIVPLFKGYSMKQRPLFWHFPIYLDGGNRETQDPVFRTRPGSAIRYGDWKLIQYFENNEMELYNLKEDPGEKENLCRSHKKKKEELLTLLENWRQSTGAPVPQKLNPDYNPNSH